MEKQSWLVLMDANRIQRYIFATNRLKEIRGASLLLEKLNQGVCKDDCRQYGGEDIFIGGGGVLATFESEDNARDYIKAVQAQYRQKTHIATITGVVVEIKDDDAMATLEHARLQLRLAKSNPATRASIEATTAIPLLTSSYFRLCQSCNQYPAVHVDEEDGQEICDACQVKRKQVKDKTTFEDYTGYARFVKRAKELDGVDERLWENVTELRSKLEELEGDNTQHIGFIHADVNGLGSFLQNLTSLEDIKKVGQKVEEAIETAVVRAAHQFGLYPKFFKDIAMKAWQFLIIVLGGDDVTLIVPAKKAVPLANAICLNFQKAIRETPSDNLPNMDALALSAGVVISKPSHPIHALAQHAEELTKSAKRLSHDLKKMNHGVVPTLDFRVIQTPSANPLDTVRQQEYQTADQKQWYTTRPLPCQSLTEQAEPSVSALLTSIAELKSVNFPRNKLNDWANLMYLPEYERILAWSLQKTRIKKRAKDALVKVTDRYNLSEQNVFTHLPWHEKRIQATPLLDILELYDFAQPMEAAHD